MRRHITVIFMALGLVAPATADSRAGFDYFVLALSWIPSWCAAEGDARAAAQCAPGAAPGFGVHGLWPQFERGWPEFCVTRAREPSRHETEAMADIMGSGTLAGYQWRKHGRCSGLSAADYFALTRAASDRIRRPAALRRGMQTSPGAIEAAFLAANPGLVADGVTVTCRGGRLHEVRVCLDRALAPRACAPDTARDCAAASLSLPPPR